MREQLKQHSRLWLAAAFVALGGLFLSGCESADPEQSNLPWARPATWEGGAPGMGGGGFNAGRDSY
ncbi:hypothetical protein [Cerasicoccus fimbriatus]|uniref:hypothetical protein n=1 Tax=Cerasicoccus fimbriatus TaxID=3014554 RepID=UPI0022B592E7|nr:hypothetical protein [Cerasicoccus sp. TK19100]